MVDNTLIFLVFLSSYPVEYLLLLALESPSVWLWKCFPGTFPLWNAVTNLLCVFVVKVNIILKFQTRIIVSGPRNDSPATSTRSACKVHTASTCSWRGPAWAGCLFFVKSPDFGLFKCIELRTTRGRLLPGPCLEVQGTGGKRCLKEWLFVFTFKTSWGRFLCLMSGLIQAAGNKCPHASGTLARVQHGTALCLSWAEPSCPTFPFFFYCEFQGG